MVLIDLEPAVGEQRAMDLKNKLVWITGASSGIGRALALALASEGSHLVLTARDLTRLEDLRSGLAGYPVRVSLAAGDVCDLERMKEIEAQNPNIDVLIANAGDYRPSEIAQFCSDDYMRLLSVNFGGMLNCMEAVIPAMKERSSGMICGVSSVVGYRGTPRAAAYGASKAAMTNFLESARFDLEQLGIKVCVISPGFVKTPLTDKNSFTMPFLVTPEYAASRIVSGIQREKLEIHFPWQFSWLCKLFRVIPFPIYNALLKRSSVVKKRD